MIGTSDFVPGVPPSFAARVLLDMTEDEFCQLRSVAYRAVCRKRLREALIWLSASLLPGTVGGALWKDKSFEMIQSPLFFLLLLLSMLWAGVIGLVLGKIALLIWDVVEVHRLFRTMEQLRRPNAPNE